MLVPMLGMHAHLAEALPAPPLAASASCSECERDMAGAVEPLWGMAADVLVPAGRFKSRGVPLLLLWGSVTSMEREPAA